MSKTNLITSAIRFLKEFDYTYNLFSIKNYSLFSKKNNLFSKYKPQLNFLKEKEKSISIRVVKVFIPNVIKVEVDSVGKSFITTFNIQKCQNNELIEAYNELNNLLLLVSPRIFNKLLFELHKEFVLRFNKTPFQLSKINPETYKIIWSEKLFYLKDVEGFTFIYKK